MIPPASATRRGGPQAQESPSADSVQSDASGRFTLQLPAGWTARPASAALGVVRPGQAPVVTFTVTPASQVPSTSQVVHATAELGGSDTREAGVSVTVGG